MAQDGARVRQPATSTTQTRQEPVGMGPLHITERGDGVNASRPGDFQDGLPGLELDGLAVYG